jgi:hypothetical protein
MTLAPFFVYKKGEENILKSVNLKIYHPSGWCFLRVYKIPHLMWLFLLNVVLNGGIPP